MQTPQGKSTEHFYIRAFNMQTARMVCGMRTGCVRIMEHVHIVLAQYVNFLAHFKMILPTISQVPTCIGTFQSHPPLFDYTYSDTGESLIPFHHCLAIHFIAISHFFQYVHATPSEEEDVSNCWIIQHSRFPADSASCEAQAGSLWQRGCVCR